MTNRCFNFGQVQGLYKIDCQEYGGSFQDYLGRVADIQGRINRNLVFTPGVQANQKGK